MKYRFDIKRNNREPLNITAGNDSNANTVYQETISSFLEGCKNSDAYDGSLITYVFTDDFELYMVSVSRYRKP